MTVNCPECGFEAKTSQGLASHRLIKHTVVPKAAEKSAELSAQAVSKVVRDLYTMLAEQAAANKRAIADITERLYRLPVDGIGPLVERLIKAHQADPDDDFDAITGRHTSLRALWDAAEGCQRCSQDKAQIIAEITARAREEWVKKPHKAEANIPKASEARSERRRKPGWESRGIIDRLKQGEDLFE